MGKRQYGWVLSSDQSEHKDFDFLRFRHSCDFLSSVEFDTEGSEVWLTAFPGAPFGLEFTEWDSDSSLCWRNGDSFEKFDSGEVCILEGDNNYRWFLMRVVPKHTAWFFRGRNWGLPSEALTEALCASAHKVGGGAPLPEMPPRITLDQSHGDALVRTLELSTGIRVWSTSSASWGWSPFEVAHRFSESRWINPEKAVAAGALWDANERDLDVWEPVLLTERAAAPGEDDWWEIHR